LNKNMG